MGAEETPMSEEEVAMAVKEATCRNKVLAIAAKNASLPDLQAIAEAHRQACRAHQTNEFEYWDSQFHQRLFAATLNELLSSIHAILQVIRGRNAWIELKRKTSSENRRRDYCEQHADVIKALEHRDAEGAAQAMLRHIEAIEIALFGRRQNLAMSARFRQRSDAPEGTDRLRGALIPVTQLSGNSSRVHANGGNLCRRS